MKYKNYYKILELKSDRVTDDEIKNAYRRLAKKYHPDINPGDEIASEKFKAVNEAYQILGDEASKKKYDRIHNFYRVKDTFEDTKEKLNKDGFSEMFEMMFGKKEENDSTIVKNNKKNSTTGEDIESQIEITLEEAFFGTNKKLAFRTFDGKMKSIVVKIPKGIKSGEKIRIAKQGKPSKDGGENGDLYIKIVLMKDERYELHGNDICMKLNLSPWEAAFGCNISVKGIDSSILVNIPEGIQTGERLKIANNGFWNENGGRGDLLLNIQIMIPKRLSEGEKLLFRKLSEISNFEPRKQ
ncbi:MAG: J domain-containing protein [Clostridia bacterium]|nr:J domain-containing protein [Clostridia bacterium]